MKKNITSCAVCTAVLAMLISAASADLEAEMKGLGPSVSVSVGLGPASAGVDTKHGPRVSVGGGRAEVAADGGGVSAGVSASLGPVRLSASSDSNGDVTLGFGLGVGITNVALEYTAPLDELVRTARHPFDAGARDEDRVRRGMAEVRQIETLLFVEDASIDAARAVLKSDMDAANAANEQVRVRFSAERDALEAQMSNYNDFYLHYRTPGHNAGCGGGNYPRSVQCCFAPICTPGCTCWGEDMFRAGEELRRRSDDFVARTTAHYDGLRKIAAAFNVRMAALKAREAARDDKKHNLDRYKMLLNQ
jgi:hypothetical protein